MVLWATEITEKSETLNRDLIRVPLLVSVAGVTSRDAEQLIPPHHSPLTSTKTNPSFHVKFPVGKSIRTLVMQVKLAKPELIMDSGIL